jgi:hypothetical protein
MSEQEEIDRLTYKINGAIFEVNRVLGAGFLEKIYEAQLLNYLKATGIKVGLLVNFKHPKADVKRFVI